MEIDYEKLSADELRGLMANARRLKSDDVYRGAFAQLCKLAPNADGQVDDLNDPLVQRFWQAVTAAEQIRTEANGKTNRLQRTRNKAAKEGVVATMEALALKPEPSDGFHYLVDEGLPHLVFEYVILETPSRFSEAAVEASRRRLNKHHIPLPA